MTLSKYSANGNDFVIFHTFVKEDRSNLAKQLCHRQNGIGADGLIVLVPSDEHDFEWQFYNSDGSEATMCGNGSRACAHYAYSNHLAPAAMKFLTGAGVIKAVVDGAMVQSDLTPPIMLNDNIEEFGAKWQLINTGVPHLVCLVEDITHFNIQEARELRHKYNANVNIALVADKEHMVVRTYERGVEDETLACGTGMAASFWAAYLSGLVNDNISVNPKSGDTLYLGKNDTTIIFGGEVTKVFEVNLQTN